MKNNLLEITWIDATYTADYWLRPDEIKGMIDNFKTMKTIGYEAIKNPDFYIICQSLSKDDKNGGYFLIPKGCVKEIRKIK